MRASARLSFAEKGAVGGGGSGSGGGGRDGIGGGGEPASSRRLSKQNWDVPSADGKATRLLGGTFTATPNASSVGTSWVAPVK